MIQLDDSNDKERGSLFIISTLQKKGHTAYIVGGFVRDSLMGSPSHDIDIVTSCSTDELLSSFDKTLSIGAQFGIIVVIHKSIQYEVATFRSDGEYVNGRKPLSIQKATPQEDAQRRDFTINGLFYDPISKTLYDYVGGQEDIKNKIIRTIGSPIERFKEDKLRILRAIRYATRLSFHIEEETYEAIPLYVNALASCVSKERIYEEISKMWQQHTMTESLLIMKETQVLDTLFPTTRNDKNWTVTFSFIKKMKKETPLIFFIALLIKDTMSQNDTIITLHNYCFPKKEIAKVSFFFDLESSYINQGNEVTAQLIRQMAHPMYQIAHDVLMAMNPSYCLFNDIFNQYIKHITALKSNTLPITSELLKHHGINQGKKLGQLLDLSFHLQIQNDTLDKDIILKSITTHPLWSS